MIKAIPDISSTSLRFFRGIKAFLKYFEEYRISDVIESIIVIIARNNPISEIVKGKN